MRCPKCGFDTVETVVNTETERKGYNWCWGILGVLLYWPLALCGLCGMGDRTTRRSVHYHCRNCGYRF